MKRGRALPSWRQAVLAVLQSRRRQQQLEQQLPAFPGPSGQQRADAIVIRRYLKCYRAGTHTAGGCRACGVK